MIANSKGLSLVEFLISMGLGVIISTAALQLFITTKQILLIQQGMARIQENARIVHILLGESIASSGKLGCHAFIDELSVHIGNLIDPKSVGLNQFNRIIGVSEDTLSQLKLSDKVRQKIKQESHLLLVHSLSQYHEVAQPVSILDNAIVVRGNFHFKKNKIIALSDCSNVDFILIKDVEFLDNKQITKINFPPSPESNISKTYKTNATVGSLAAKLFYVGQTERYNASGAPIHALYSTDLNGRTLELIEGVEQMILQFGVNNDETIEFMAAGSVQNWLQVVKVRASILLNSVEDASPQPKPYLIVNREIMPTDRLMRMWWHFEWEIKGHV